MCKYKNKNFIIYQCFRQQRIMAGGCICYMSIGHNNRNTYYLYIGVTQCQGWSYNETCGIL